MLGRFEEGLNEGRQKTRQIQEVGFRDCLDNGGWLGGGGGAGSGGEMEAKIINGFLNPVPFTTSMPFTGISRTLSHSVLPSSRKVGMFVLISEMRRRRPRERFA